MPSPIDLVKTLFESGLSLGTPRSRGPLILAPLYGGIPAPEYLIGAEAFASGQLRIEELGGGSVSQLIAKNGADVPVLLIDGEHLQGARQDRVLNSSVLLAARHDTILPVSCVEQGRWTYEGRSDFVPAKEMAWTHLRAAKKAAVLASMARGQGFEADQGEVWLNVAVHHAQLGVDSSRTGAMGDAYDRHRDTLDGILAGFPVPEQGQTAVVVCLDGRPTALDAFDRPETLAMLWPRLVSGYAIDAVGRPPASMDPAAAGGLQRQVEAWVRSAALAGATSHEGIGLGMHVMLTDDAHVADGLVWEGAVVHAAAFATTNNDQGQPRLEERIAPPQGRIRFRRRPNE